ncbi:hypothetical protein A2U01_0091289, partial [Trifolium medium]|nr:hypothetical protein [Trifolium medium]
GHSIRSHVGGKTDRIPDSETAMIVKNSESFNVVVVAMDFQELVKVREGIVKLIEDIFLWPR